MGLILQVPLGVWRRVTLVMSMELQKKGLSCSGLALSSLGRMKLILLGCGQFSLVRLQQTLMPEDQQMMELSLGLGSWGCDLFLKMLVTWDCSRCQRCVQGFLRSSQVVKSRLLWWMLGLVLHQIELERVFLSLAWLYLGSLLGDGLALTQDCDCCWLVGKWGVALFWRWGWLEKQRCLAGAVAVSSYISRQLWWPLLLRLRLLALLFLRCSCWTEEARVLLGLYCLFSMGREKAQGLTQLLILQGTICTSFSTVLKLLCAQCSLFWLPENFREMSFLRYFSTSTLGILPESSSVTVYTKLKAGCEYSQLLYFFIRSASTTDSMCLLDLSLISEPSRRRFQFLLACSLLLLSSSSSLIFAVILLEESSRSGSMWFLLRLQRLTVEFSSFSCSVMQQLELRDCVAWMLILPREGQKPLERGVVLGRRGLKSRSLMYSGSLLTLMGLERGVLNLMCAAWERRGLFWGRAGSARQSSWRSCWQRRLFLEKSCWCWQVGECGGWY